MVDIIDFYKFIHIYCSGKLYESHARSLFGYGDSQCQED